MRIVWKHALTSSMYTPEIASIPSRPMASVRSLGAGSRMRISSRALLVCMRIALSYQTSFSFTVDVTAGEIFESLVVLRILKPLAEAGIIVFGPAATLSCSDCAKAARAAERQLRTQLWQEFRRTRPEVFRYKDGSRWHMSFGSPLFTSAGDEYRVTAPATREAIAASKPNVVLVGKNAMDIVQQYRKSLQRHLARSAHGVVFSTQMAGSCNSTVAANTREEAAGYRLLDRRKVGSTLPDWSLLRTVPLPALQRLSALQALQVRNEAEKAMPAFRAKLQRDLMSLKDASDEAEEKRALEVAAELRVEARDLQGQLASLRLPSIRRSEKLFAGLAVALEIVALSTGSPSAMLAVSGTFAGLMLAARKGERDRQEKQEVLVHQPAYVLLTAERIHAGGH